MHTKIAPAASSARTPAAESTLDPKLATLFDALAQAPSERRMPDLDMVQKFGEGIFSHFPAKHDLNFHFGEGLTLLGKSDSWVNPPAVGLTLYLNGARLPDSLHKEFAERTGRNLYECAVNEAQRRLETGDISRTLRQELSESIKDVSPGPGLQRALGLIHQAVDRAQSSDWQASEAPYHSLAGKGYLLDVSDLTDAPPFSCLRGNSDLVIGISKTHTGAVIELGYRAPRTGSFRPTATISGDAAVELLTKVSGPIDILRNGLNSERVAIEEHFSAAVDQVSAAGWSFQKLGSIWEVTGQIGSFTVVLKADERASYEGVTALVQPKANIYTGNGPELVRAKPTNQDLADGLAKVLETRLDMRGVLVDRFTEDSPQGQYLLGRVEAKLQTITADTAKEFYRGWHANVTTLKDPTWQVTTNRDLEESVVMSPDGLSVGCFTGGRSGGFKEAFKFTSPRAKAIAARASSDIAELQT